MVTSIQISEDLQKALAQRKVADRETYEEVIWNLLEDTRELNEETKRRLEESREQARQGKTYPLSEIKRIHRL